MITIIFGAPGSGKSTLNTLLLKQEYMQQGRTLYAKTCKRIIDLNKDRTQPLTLPDRPPIYADFKMQLQTGYKKYFNPFFVDGYHLGLDNAHVQITQIVPGAKIHLSEVQRYYDSRKSQTFPEWVSRFFEMHRHYGVDVTMDLQRASLVDINIRDLCRHFIEVQSMKHTLDDMGRIIHTKFVCREFKSYLDVEEYINNNGKNYETTTYTNEGNIYRCFDSCAYFKNFVPADDKDFSYMEFGNNSIIEPKEFRHPDKKKANAEVA